jgi:hypothetical protein
MESKLIPKYVATNDDRDFDFLKRKGLEHIEEMSRKLWTDYNSHDPGITILEALCYAITDLGNRIQFPIADLLTEAGKKENSLKGNFPTAKTILTTSAVSETDYRKLIIDIEGVKNAFIHVNTDQVIYRHCLRKSESDSDDPWGKLSYEKDLSPHYEKIDSFALKGLYNISFEPDHDIQLLEKGSEERKKRIAEITREIVKRYHANRNVCEDLVRVEEVKYKDVLVCGDIEIERTANASDVMTEMMFRVKEYLSPTVKRFTLDELLEQGLNVESIYDGPILQNGFVPDEELKKTAIKSEIYLSDLIRIVTEIPGVKSIRKLKMGPCKGARALEDIEDRAKQKWKICLPEEGIILPRLCAESSIKRTNLFKDVVPVPTDFETISGMLDERIESHEQTISLNYDDLPAPSGSPVDTATYRSIQNDLPQIYGTGENGVSPSLPPVWHAAAKQLKAYLLFFDQILASYFGHLKSVGSMLSSELGSGTYSAGYVKDVADFDAIVQDAENYQNSVQETLENHDEFKSRKNSFLDHLLARFSENMNDYAFAMLENFGENLTSATLWHKSNLLEEYPSLSANRARAFNYHAGEENAWDTFQVSGLQKRIARLLGIRNYSRRAITKTPLEIVEGDESGTVIWKIRAESGDDLLVSAGNFETEAEAEKDLWKSVAQGWDPSNIKIEKAGGRNKFRQILIDNSGESLAVGKKLFASRKKAEEAVSAISNYLFNHVSDEGFFLFEPILLRPDRDDGDADKKFMHICMDSDCRQCHPGDPYSLRLMIVLPGWTKRFSNLHFREYAENVIRREVPAHVLCRICWIGNAVENEDGEWSTEDGPMQQLQQLYQKWITKKMESPANQKENEFLKPLADMLHDLETVYPEGKLFDCKTAGREDTDSSIVLGKSTIGELKNKKNGDE